MHAVVLALMVLQPVRDPPRQAVVLTSATVVQVEAGPHEAVEFLLTNNTGHSITGYGVRFVVTFADGTTRRGGWGVPGPLPEEGPSLRAVPPRSSVRQSHAWGPQSTNPAVDVSVRLEWAIFGDRSFIGDAGQVNVAFGDRERFYASHAFVAQALRAGRDEGKSGVEALAAALRRLRNAPVEMSHAVNGVRGNLQRAIEGQVTVDPDTYLFSLLRMAEQERDRIQPHRRTPY